jgi:UDP-glucose 6-dehydrogenase
MQGFTNIAIVGGLGVVGAHTAQELSALNPIIIDPKNDNYNDIKNNAYEVAFICVPTESNPDGSANIEIVEDAVMNTNADILVIKSAVPPLTAEILANKYNKRIVSSIEYFGSTIHAINNPNWVVLGGKKNDTARIAELYYRVKPASFRVVFTDNKTAELAKYMENAFLGLKVSFCAEFADIAKQFGIEYPALREIAVLDPRFGESHTFIDPDKPYYNSHCLNKDIKALNCFADTAIMKVIESENKKRKSNG